MFIFRSVPRQLSIREKFPPPWRVRQIPGGYGVEDSTGRNPLHVYGDEGLRRSIMGLLTRAEAIAKAIARLPSLMERAGG